MAVDAEWQTAGGKKKGRKNGKKSQNSELPDNAKKEETHHDAMLRSFDLDGIAQYIVEHEVQKVVIVCGAGISTSAGIPDFRSPGTGLYHNLQRFNLPEPQAIFDLQYFKHNPEAFYELCKDMWPGNYEPTPCHYFIRLLSDKGILLRCYSQNIDSLERQAGIPMEKLVAAHGNFDAAHVIDDHGIDDSVEVDIAELKSALDQDGSEGWEALREWHGGLVKPRIVFFGENLPERWALHQDDMDNCELLIVMGTSLQVRPVAGLPERVPLMVPRLLLNREPVGVSNLDGGFRFHMEGEKKNWRDVFHGDDCDSGVRKLSCKLGWNADLNALIESKGTFSADRAPWVARNI